MHAFFAAAALAVVSADPAPTYDVVVYGGTSGGIAAAVQTARMGKSVVLIEPTKFIGGLTTGGLGATDIGNKAAIGGIAREFYQRLKAHYVKPTSWRQAPAPKSIDEDAVWKFEPHVAMNLYQEMIQEAKVPVVYEERLDLKDGVKKFEGRIVEIKMESGKVFRGKMFIDGTYEGDLMAEAGVSYHVGREANSTYNETLNGVQTKNATHHQFIVKVDPYVKPGDPKSGLLFGIQADGPGEEGSGDKRVQAYNFRLCMTDVPENQVAWPKPENYDESRYELLLRNLEAGDLRIPHNPVIMPNRKTDTNNNFAVSTDFMGMNYDYPDGDYATRDKIFENHKSWQMGFYWTLANHPRVPEKVKKEIRRWGLAKDEFTTTGNWPHQMYVREARRMVSDYVMTENDCRGKRVSTKPVSLAAYNMDSHNTQRHIREGHVLNEGDIQVGVRPYPIDYASIVPKAEQCKNLFVPVCLSSTHIAFGSIRMEPVFMILGQSSATAAVFAIDDGVDVQKVDYDKLKVKLLADKQVLEWKAPPGNPNGAKAGGVPLADLKGVVVDDSKAVFEGEWATGSAIGPYVADGYHHDSNEDKGKKVARFKAELPKAGKYEVRLAYSPQENRASNTPVVVHHGAETTKKLIDQKSQPTIDKTWVTLGVYEFPAGATEVEIRTEATNGHVIADAIQWLPILP